MKRIIGLILAAATIVFFTSCKNNSQDTVSDDSKLQISVTFNALAEFASAIGKDKIEVSTIVPAGAEPHDFEPKAADIARLSKAQIFVYNGLGMEAWVEDAIKAAANEDLTVVTATDGADPINNTEEAIKEHGEYDPHLWLSIQGAIIEVQNIADTLCEIDVDNKDYYQTNASEYIEQLEGLFSEYSDKFAALNNKNFVTGHAAFNYFCRDFDLTQNSVEDVFAEGEPSTRQLAKLVDYCKEKQVTTIFAEEMASSEISKTLASEVGADIETIYTMEGPEDDLSYLDRIRSNCEKVYQSLAK